MNCRSYSPIFMVLMVVCSIISKESKHVNNHTSSQINGSIWLAEIKTILGSKTGGQFITHDSQGLPIVLEWHTSDIVSPDLAAFKKEVSDLAAQVTAQGEMNFLQANPQAVSQDGFLRACEPLFAQGVAAVDWQAVNNTLQSSIKQFYLMDLSQFGPEVIGKLADDICYYASVKDQQTGALLGFIMSSITPALPYGDSKVINVVISPQAKNSGLETILLSSLLRVIEPIQRMFIMVRPTNSEIIAAYSACGFVQDNNPIQDPHHQVNKEYFIVMEYKTEQSDILQKTAGMLLE